jgi:hypothetical protein
VYSVNVVVRRIIYVDTSAFGDRPGNFSKIVSPSRFLFMIDIRQLRIGRLIAEIPEVACFAHCF